MLHLYRQKKKAARRPVDKARNNMEEEVYNKFEEDGRRKTIYNFACGRDEDRKDNSLNLITCLCSPQRKFWSVIIYSPAFCS